MLIEGTSSSLHIPFCLFVCFCLKSLHNIEKITPSPALTGRKIWLRSAVHNTGERRGDMDDKRHRKGDGGRFYRGDEIWKKRKR